ncbi:hypothetical protein M011DRAFT_476479 [Sporormia fimetaria CBS 119925]|uniref:Uncharacterized protein n=1 Tax=Sporormia fimetaria CBS 119925 TaxID=1340428 RepID=A0A6A6VCX1_9PLEO|nr:hypothetical protein M011DRAFT_476479 [Sporormia fimetaria CBS 119925]
MKRHVNLGPFNKPPEVLCRMRASNCAKSRHDCKVAVQKEDGNFIPEASAAEDDSDYVDSKHKKPKNMHKSYACIDAQSNALLAKDLFAGKSLPSTQPKRKAKPSATAKNSRVASGRVSRPPAATKKRALNADDDDDDNDDEDDSDYVDPEENMPKKTHSLNLFMHSKGVFDIKFPSVQGQISAEDTVGGGDMLNPKKKYSKHASTYSGHTSFFPAHEALVHLDDMSMVVKPGCRLHRQVQKYLDVMTKELEYYDAVTMTQSPNTRSRIDETCRLAAGPVPASYEPWGNIQTLLRKWEETRKKKRMGIVGN